MNKPYSVTVDFAVNYPIFKRDGDTLVPLERQEQGKRYGLVTDESGQTKCIQFTDEEEAAADRQKLEWEAGAPAREAEEQRKKEEARKFEESLKYRDRIVAFIDILGWSDAVSKGRHDKEAVVVLGHALSKLSVLVAQHKNLQSMTADVSPWTAELTQFSDCLVISVDDNHFGKGTIEQALWLLSGTLIWNGFLIRGGIVRGPLFHSNSMVFGPALNEAYALESKHASSPRVILSPDLAKDWSQPNIDGGMPWIQSPDGYYFYNYLPPFAGSPFFKDNKELWQQHLGHFRDLILKKAKDRSCPDHVYAKYEWLAGYFDLVVMKNPECGVPRVSEEARMLRWMGN